MFFLSSSREWECLCRVLARGGEGCRCANHLLLRGQGPRAVVGLSSDTEALSQHGKPLWAAFPCFVLGGECPGAAGTAWGCSRPELPVVCFGDDAAQLGFLFGVTPFLTYTWCPAPFGLFSTRAPTLARDEGPKLVLWVPQFGGKQGGCHQRPAPTPAAAPSSRSASPPAPREQEHSTGRQ